MRNIPKLETIEKVRDQLRYMVFDRWKEKVFLTWEWWLLLLLTILPWVIWWKFVDKNRLYEILPFGLIIIILTSTLDILGTELLWWSYPIKLVPVVPPLITPDVAIVPCLMMVVYQYFTSWKSFFLANFVLSVLAAFLGENLFIWLDYYELNSWKLIYSVLYYNVAGAIARWIITKINEKRYGKLFSQ